MPVKNKRGYNRPNFFWSDEKLNFIRKYAKKYQFPEITELFNKHYGTNVKVVTLRTVAGDFGIKTFRKGQKTSPIGTEWILDGYVLIKFQDTGNYAKDRKFKHHLIWEQANGRKVPKGHRIIFADGNRRNFDIDNLLCVTAREAVMMNSHHLYFPNQPEMTKAGLAVVRHRIQLVDTAKKLFRVKETSKSLRRLLNKKRGRPLKNEN